MSPYAVGIVDKNSLFFLRVNKTAQELYGFSNEEFRQLTIYDLRVSEDIPKVREQNILGKYSSDLSVRIHKTRSGSRIWVEPSFTEFEYYGKPAYLITIKDISEKVRAEDELRKVKSQHGKQLIEAEEKSRSEIGAELHDNISQLITASILYLRNLTALTAEDNIQLEKALELIITANQEIRKLSTSLVLAPANMLSLKESIEMLLRQFELSGIRFNVDIQIGETGMDTGLKANLYRIIQEQVHNIVKHSQATQAIISITGRHHSLILEITDNGIGFDPKERRRGIGLGNIFHRAEIYNGTVHIDSSAGNGCRLWISFEDALGRNIDTY